MKSLYFLPQWCMNKKEIKKNKRLKLLVLIILVANIILLNIFVVNKSQLNDIETKLEGYNSVKKLSHNRNSTFENYLNFYNYISLGRNFKSIDVENRSLNLDVEGNEKDCFSIIRDAEKSDKFIVKNFKFMGNDEEGKKVWKINLKFK